MSASEVVLEPQAAEFAAATADPPYLFDLGPVDGRKTVDDVQAGEIAKPVVRDEWLTVEGGPTGSVEVRIVRPTDAAAVVPVILYLHGAGWVFGNAHTHDRLVRELAVGTGAAVVFPEYDLSPEARYPTGIEQTTPRRAGSSSTAPSAGSTPPGSPSPATPSAATWRPR